MIESNKRKWIRYLHNHILEYGDGRASQIREMLLEMLLELEEVDCQKLYNQYDDAYPNLLTLEQFIRNEKINQILND